MFFSCEKSIQPVPTKVIELQISETEDSIFLIWNNPNSIHFEKYQFLSSTTDEFLPESFLGQQQYIWRTENQERTNYEIRKEDDSQKIYFKIIAIIDGAEFHSNIVHTNSDNLPLNIHSQKAISDIDHNRVYLLSNHYEKLVCYNYKEERIESTNDSHFFGNEIITVGKSDLPEIYTRSESNIIIFDGGTLISKDTIHNEVGFSSIATNNKNIIAVASYRENHPIDFYHHSNKTLINSFDLPHAFSTRHIEFLSKENNKLIVSHKNGIDLICLNESGEEIISHLQLQNNSPDNSIQKINISPNGQYIIIGSNGGIYNTELEVIGSLENNTSTSFSDFAFSTHNDKLFAFISESYYNNYIYEFALPSLELVNQYDVRSGIIQMFTDEENLILVKSYSSPFGTVILKNKI